MLVLTVYITVQIYSKKKKKNQRKRAPSLGHRPMEHGVFFLLKHVLRGKSAYLLHSKLAISLKSSLEEKPIWRGSEAPANSQHPLSSHEREPPQKCIFQNQTSLQVTAALADI